MFLHAGSNSSDESERISEFISDERTDFTQREIILDHRCERFVITNLRKTSNLGFLSRPFRAVERIASCHRFFGAMILRGANVVIRNSALLRKMQLTSAARAFATILTDVIGMCVVRERANWVSKMHPEADDRPCVRQGFTVFLSGFGRSIDRSISP